MKVAISFTGGKDSVLSLTLAQLSATSAIPESVTKALGAHASDLKDAEVAMLVTFAPAEGGAFKAHPMELVKLQAEALDLPHHIISIEGPDYLASYVAAMKKLQEDHGIQALVTGDVLDVCNDFMGRASKGAGLPLLRPLWGMPRRQLLQCLWDLGVKPIVSCVNLAKFSGEDGSPACGAGTASASAPAAPATSAQPSSSAATAPAQQEQPQLREGAQPGGEAAHARQAAAAIVGRELDAQLHASFLVPASQRLGIDECGEWGEMHTMCLDGPTFKRRVVLREVGVQQDAGSGHAFLALHGGCMALEAKA